MPEPGVMSTILDKHLKKCVSIRTWWYDIKRPNLIYTQELHNFNQACLKNNRSENLIILIRTSNLIEFIRELDTVLN